MSDKRSLQDTDRQVLSPPSAKLRFEMLIEIRKDLLKAGPLSGNCVKTSSHVSMLLLVFLIHRVFLLLALLTGGAELVGP